MCLPSAPCKGCCASRPASSGSNANVSPYPPVSSNNNAPDSSSRNITAPSPAAAVSLASPRGSQSVAPNTPLKRIPPTLRSKLPNTLSSPASQRRRITPTSNLSSLSSPTRSSSQDVWTRSRLQKERGDWWDTRVTGEQIVWETLRSMCDLVQKGEVEEAQAILTASGCTCPSGEIWRGIFDERGVLYKMEDWVVVEPYGVVEDDEVEDELAEDLSALGLDDADGPEDKEVEIQDSGRGKQPDVQLNVRCRISSPPKDYLMKINKSEKVSHLVSCLATTPELQDKRFRLFVLGFPLNDRLTLEEASPRWNESIWVNVMVFA
ncbi:hypothetical protein BDV96DRAFT_641494 [Lophiotrema nucula]|uniref:DC-UbP/UBTD2 N-terminal domain-containing protein n=1 Tax=Lophiotrema nucula TaxID=690887 RepID=A0A6A5ZME8_9PLEO|nr:hypothetical protein BDV96DRAFT_641494 [Lophiotrema nucula]